MDEDAFKEKLNPEQYRVMRQKGTETAYTGQYWESDERGMYECAACDTILFISFHKEKSPDGWPRFSRPVNRKNIEKERTETTEELRCSTCKSHLGWVIDEKDGEHYRVNSIALKFVEMPELDWDKSDEQKKLEEQKAAEAAKAPPPPPPKWKTWGVKLGTFTIVAAIGAGGHSIMAAPAKCVPTASQTATSTPTASKSVVKPPVAEAATIPPAPAISAASSTDASSTPAGSTGSTGSQQAGTAQTSADSASSASAVGTH